MGSQGPYIGGGGSKLGDYYTGRQVGLSSSNWPYIKPVSGITLRVTIFIIVTCTVLHPWLRRITGCHTITILESYYCPRTSCNSCQYDSTRIRLICLLAQATLPVYKVPTRPQLMLARGPLEDWSEGNGTEKNQRARFSRRERRAAFLEVS